MLTLKDVWSQAGTKDNRAGSMIVKDIPIGDIHIKINVRNTYRGIEELAENIRQFGLQQPITVYRDGEEYFVKTGHRRFKAYELLFTNDPDRFNSIRCVVSDEKDIAIIQLIENVQRENLTDKELFAALCALRAQKISHKEIATIFGKSIQWVDKKFTVVNEIIENPRLMEYTSDGGSLDDIAETTGVPDAQRFLLFEKRQRHELSRHGLREEAQKWKQKNVDKSLPPEQELYKGFSRQKLKKVEKSFMALGIEQPASEKPVAVKKEILHDLKIKLSVGDRATYDLLSKSLDAVLQAFHVEVVTEMESKRYACHNCYR